MNKKVIDCKMCGTTCRKEDAVIVFKVMEPEDIIRVHRTLENIFGE